MQHSWKLAAPCLVTACLFASSDGVEVRPLTETLTGGVIFPSDRVLEVTFEGDWEVTQEPGLVLHTAQGPHSLTVDVPSEDPGFDVDRITYQVQAGAEVHQYFTHRLLVLEAGEEPGS